MAETSVRRYGDIVRLRSFGTGQDEDAVVAKFLTTLRDEQIKTHLLPFEFESLMEAVEAAAKLEYGMRKNKEKTVERSAPREKIIQKCYKCG